MKNIHATTNFLIRMFILIAVMFVATLPFSGCRRIIDRIFNGNQNVVGDCRISKIIQEDTLSNEVRTGIVYYNDRNDPDSVIFETQVYGPVYFYFTYNDAGQLVEYREMYSREPADYYAWHKYISVNGIVVQDTARIRVAGQSTEVRNIQYDANGRVVKETNHLIELDNAPWDEERTPFTYYYDEFGNLNGDRYVYDGKVNFLRTNKVWMFTQRNYSMNNRFEASTYNERGLPLTFEPEKAPYFLLAYAAITRVEYECESK